MGNYSWPLAEFPPDGRLVERSRRVRLGDVSTNGQLRLDALARYLQDVAADDVNEAGLAGAWVLRRLLVEIKARPEFAVDVDLATFCSGSGPRWAERRTTLKTADRLLIEAVGLWVFVDSSGRPAELEKQFLPIYGDTARDRKVSGRLRLPSPPANAPEKPFVTRSSDFDVLGHMNNAVAWVVIEQEVLHVEPQATIVSALLEYRTPVAPGSELKVVSSRQDDCLMVWILGANETFVSARLVLTQ